jgi:hypothetical protein
MKKIHALVLVLSLMAAMVFAEPVALASKTTQIAGSSMEQSLLSPLFADIDATQLTASEADAVEGDGWGWGVGLGSIFGVVGAGAVVGFTSNFQYGPTATFSGLKAYALYGFGLGFSTGFLIGLAF